MTATNPFAAMKLDGGATHGCPDRAGSTSISSPERSTGSESGLNSSTKSAVNKHSAFNNHSFNFKPRRSAVGCATLADPRVGLAMPHCGSCPNRATVEPGICNP